MTLSHQKIISAGWFVTDKKTVETLNNELLEASVRIEALSEALAIRQKEFRDYELLFSGIGDLAYICDTGGRILYINKAFEKLSGRKVSEFMGRPFAPLFDGEDLKKAIDNYTRTLRGESPVYEIRFKETGTLCQFKNRPIEDEFGVIAGVMGTARDITLQKAMEDDLRKKSALFAEAQSVGRLGCWEWDIKKNSITWSEGLYSIYGFDPKTDSPAAFGDFLSRVHPDDRKQTEAVVKKALIDKKPFEVVYRHLRADGTVMYIHSRAEVFCGKDGEPVRLVGSTRDITEQKMAELERGFKSIFEDAYDGMLIADPETKRFHMANRAMCKELGYTEDEIRGLSVADIHPPDFLPIAAQDFEKIGAGEFTIAKDVPVVRKDRSIYYVNITASKVNIEGKLYFLGILRDVAELRLASEEARRYKAGLEAIFRSVKDAIITVDRDYRVLEINEAAERMCCLTRDSIGEDFSAIRCDSHCMEAVSRTMREGEPVEMLRVLCDRCDMPAHNRVISIYTQPLMDERGEFSGVVLVIKDETRIAGLERDLGQRTKLHNFIGRSHRLQQIYSLVETLAQTQTTVLITGESGTGKELVAQAIQHTGARREGPYVKVNCAALPEQLLESELFGHIKGAFTGAVKDRVGRFELADGGTIFLDEIGDISSGVQVRLLRVLQEREFERVGDSKTRNVNIRIIAATNTDLAEKVRRGAFREDLYYRLKVIELALPPLRDRLEDLPFLMEHFVAGFNSRYGKGIAGVSEAARALLMSYQWPGNVRELEHALEHAFVLCGGQVITPEHLPPAIHNVSRAKPTGLFAAVDERSGIIRALENTSWNKAKAARLLGISRRTIYRKMELHSINESSRVP